MAEGFWDLWGACDVCDEVGGELVGGRGECVESLEGMADGDASAMSVVDSCLDVDWDIGGFLEPMACGSDPVLFIDVRVCSWGAAACIGDGVGVAVRLTFTEPICEVEDPGPCGDAGPDGWGASCEEHGAVSAAGDADEVDAIGVDLGGGLGPFDGAENVCDGEFGSAGFGSVVGSAEVRVDEGPVFFDAPFGVGGLGLAVVIGPRVEGDEEGDWRFGFGPVEQGGLLGLIGGTAVEGLGHFGLPAGDGCEGEGCGSESECYEGSDGLHVVVVKLAGDAAGVAGRDQPDLLADHKRCSVKGLNKNGFLAICADESDFEGFSAARSLVGLASEEQAAQGSADGADDGCFSGTDHRPCDTAGYAAGDGSDAWFLVADCHSSEGDDLHVFEGERHSEFAGGVSWCADLCA